MIQHFVHLLVTNILLFVGQDKKNKLGGNIKD